MKLNESNEARKLLDSLCKQQEHQLISQRKENMLRDLEQDQSFNHEMVERIAEMEKQNDYLQRKLIDNNKDFKTKDQ